MTFVAEHFNSQNNQKHITVREQNNINIYMYRDHSILKRDTEYNDKIINSDVIKHKIIFKL